MNIDPVSSQILQPDPRAGTPFGVSIGVEQGHQVPDPSLTTWQGQVTDAVQRLFASGTTAQRPSNPVLAQQYYDTTLGRLLICTTIATGNNTNDAVWTVIPGLQSNFEVRLNASQVQPVNTATVVPYNLVTIDARNWWDGVNFRWVPKIPGEYFFYCQTTISSTAATNVWLAYVRLNGLTTRPTIVTTTAIGQLQGINCSRRLAMNGSTDYVDFAILDQLGGGTVYGPAFGNAFSYAGGFLVP